MKIFGTLYFKLGGGLGNQIFQYAAVQYCADQQKVQPIFDIGGLDSAHHGQKSLITNLNFAGNFSSPYLIRKFWRILLKVSRNRILVRTRLGIYLASATGYEKIEKLGPRKIKYLESMQRRKYACILEVYALKLTGSLPLT